MKNLNSQTNVKSGGTAPQNSPSEETEKLVSGCSPTACSALSSSKYFIGTINAETKAEIRDRSKLLQSLGRQREQRDPSLAQLRSELSRHENGLSADQSLHLASLVTIRDALQARQLVTKLPWRLRLVVWLLTPLEPPNLEVDRPLLEASPVGQ